MHSSPIQNSENIDYHIFVSLQNYFYYIIISSIQAYQKIIIDDDSVLISVHLTDSINRILTIHFHTFSQYTS